MTDQMAAEGCPHMTDPATCLDCERDREHERLILSTAAGLTTAIGDAQKGTGRALAAAESLTRGSAWYIEMAEGDGPDAIHELEAAARHLRNAERIAGACTHLLAGWE